MITLSGVILAVELVLGMGAAAQISGSGDRPMGPDIGGTSGQESSQLTAMRKTQHDLTKEEDPELYAFLEKQQGIENQIKAVLKRFADRKISKVAAKGRLRNLMKEEREIQEDLDFQAEHRLAQVLFASPEFQKKMNDAARAFKKKRREAP